VVLDADFCTKNLGAPRQIRTREHKTGAWLEAPHLQKGLPGRSVLMTCLVSCRDDLFGILAELAPIFVIISVSVDSNSHCTGLKNASTLCCTDN
jgi:hypothetical protein